MSAPTPLSDEDQLPVLGLNVESDYGAVTPTRWSQPWSAESVKVLTVIGAIAVGFLLTSGVVAGRTAAQEQNRRKDELVELVRARQDRAARLSGQLEALRDQVEVAQNAVEARGAQSLQNDLERVAEATGLTALTGPGVKVVFSDAQGTCSSGRPDDCRIQDTDVQLALNALWSAGAEAVAVNGERVVATTAVRNAGSAILVNYRVLTSPYTVEAIGDPEAMREQFLETQLARDFAAWQETFNLGFSVDLFDEMTLPSYTGAVRVNPGTRVDPPEDGSTS